MILKKTLLLLISISTALLESQSRTKKRVKFNETDDELDAKEILHDEEKV